ncbi:hypothetical protein Tco_0771067 [Tanacetum coccineum]|uniref:Reverse transcriptase domain-containing protein n=1 Tax=Tanacetum coccineum TaxID=301880 RepID=A0ABQ4ZFB6_9ASTR
MGLLKLNVLKVESGQVLDTLLFARLIEDFGFALHRVRSRLVSDSTTRDVEWEPIEERLKEPKEGWMLGESKKRSIWISSRMLIVGLVPRSQNCMRFAITINGESEERGTVEGIIQNYYDREDGETTPRFEAYCLVGVVLLVKDCRMINLIGKSWQKARILELKRRYFEDYYSEDQYAVSIKEDTTYPCLHSPKNHRGLKPQYVISRHCGPYTPEFPIRRIQSLDTPLWQLLVILFSSYSPRRRVVALEVGAVSVTSPARVLDLVDYSSSASDPSEDSSPLAPEIPLVPPFLYFYDSEADSESEPTLEEAERHDTFALMIMMFPVTPVVAPPRICRRPMILIRPDLHRDVYLIIHRIVILHQTDCHSSPDFTSDSSSFDSSLDYLSDTSLGSPSDSLSDTSLIHSSGCDTSGQTHSGSPTRVASPRLVYPPVMTLRYSEAFRHCRSASLSTPYPPMTSESSPYSSSERSLDSSSPSTGPSRKRCISPTIAISSSTLVLRSIALTHVDILPPPKSIGMRVKVAASDIREDEEEFEAEASAGGTMEIIVDPLVTGGISEYTRGDAPDLKGNLYDIAHYMSEVPLNRITEIRRLGWEYLRVRALLCIERDWVDSLRHYMALSQEEFRQICMDRNDARRRLGRKMINCAWQKLAKAKTNFGIRNGSNDEVGYGVRPVVRECTYHDFMKCQPLNFKGTEGVVGLIRWFEKKETVFYISNCPEKYQVKTIGTDAVFAMSWREEAYGRYMTEVYAQVNEIQKRNNIQGNVIAEVPTRLQDVVCIANNLMDQKLKGYAMKNAENKRIQEPIRLETMKEECIMDRCLSANQVKVSHEGHGIVKMGKCTRKGHYRSDCPKLKDQNRGNKTGNKSGIGEARGKAYVLGGGDANPDSNVVTNVSYVVELADERISETNTVLRGSTLGLLGDRVAKERSRITKKETKDKSEEKRLEDVPTVRDFPKVFSEDLPGLPPTRQANVVADALSRKERIKPLRVRALVMTIGLNLPVQILNAQVEARKEENYGTKDLGGMIKKLEPRADGTLCLKNKVGYLFLVT